MMLRTGLLRLVHIRIFLSHIPTVRRLCTYGHDLYENLIIFRLELCRAKLVSKFSSGPSDSSTNDADACSPE